MPTPNQTEPEPQAVSFPIEDVAAISTRRIQAAANGEQASPADITEDELAEYECSLDAYDHQHNGEQA